MRTLTLALVIAAGSQLGATDCGNALKDTGFDLWCGDQLCAWKIERGDIQKVPTWNDGDPGVELVGSDVAIEQLSPVDSSDGTCLEFTLIANVDDNADVELDVDVFGDGSVEHSERIPTAHWKPVSFDLPIQAPYAGVRFEIAKTGSGRAQLANIGAKIVTGCGGLPAIIPGKAPLGAPCVTGGDCTSGLCGVSALPTPFHVNLLGDTVCVACDAMHPCMTGDVCAADAPTSPVRAVPTDCVAQASRELGEQCSADAECASGICQYTACSTCREGTTCTGGQACGPDWNTPFDVSTPYVCAPGAHLRASGEPCASDADCASGTCNGTARSQCNDGRDCATDSDCPFEGLNNTPCTPVGVQGGSCR